MGGMVSRMALVTGAAEGFGAPMAAWFVRKGARVILTDIQREKEEVLFLASSEASCITGASFNADGGLTQ